MANPTRACLIDGCDRQINARLVCKKHYNIACKMGSLDELPRAASRKCERCGTTYQPPTLKPSRFCSRRCRDAGRSPARDIKTCQECGSEFLPAESRHIYCSRTCSQRGRRAQQTGYRRRELYGITDDEYAALLAEQDGRCALCPKVFTETGRRGPHIDHDHITGQVRGILCGPCNRAIGLFRDDPALLLRAADYLAQSRGQLFAVGT